MHPPEQPDRKEFMKEFGGHTQIALVVMFAVSTTAQVFSRRPGSLGRRFLGFYFVGALLLFAMYYHIKLGVVQYYDAIAIERTIGAVLAWFSVHGICRALRDARGEMTHSHDPGTPLFAYPGLPYWISTLISDLTVALGLTVFYHAMNSPIQRDFFVWIVLPAIVISQAWVQSRQAYIRQRFVDAAAEAKQYAGTIGRR